jgi:hypothetical protein
MEDVVGCGEGEGKGAEGAVYEGGDPGEKAWGFWLVCGSGWGGCRLIFGGAVVVSEGSEEDGLGQVGVAPLVRERFVAGFDARGSCFDDAADFVAESAGSDVDDAKLGWREGFVKI